MHYFHLLSSDTPPEPLEGHPPYVTPDEAIRAAAQEAKRRETRVQVFRGADGRFESQPWRVVLPDGTVES